MNQAPMVVVYPESFAERAQAQRELRGEMVAGIRKMGSYLKERVQSGASDLPSITQINSLVDHAIEEMDNIDQPINESRDQRLRRLGLRSATLTLAKTVRDS